MLTRPTPPPPLTPPRNPSTPVYVPFDSINKTSFQWCRVRRAAFWLKLLNAAPLVLAVHLAFVKSLLLYRFFVVFGHCRFLSLMVKRGFCPLSPTVSASRTRPRRWRQRRPGWVAALMWYCPHLTASLLTLFLHRVFIIPLSPSSPQIHFLFQRFFSLWSLWKTLDQDNKHSKKDCCFFWVFFSQLLLHNLMTQSLESLQRLKKNGLLIEFY